MAEIAERYRKVASGFTERVRAVPPGAWDNQSPCEGWLARDVVRHLVEWVPDFFRNYAGLELGRPPSVDDDPARAWEALRDAVERTLDEPAVAGREFEMRGARYTIEQAVDTFFTPDVLVHTWDLARATGLDETLDPDEVSRLLEAMTSVDEQLLRGSGQYGPRVDVPEDADGQTKLIAFTGRRP